MRSFGPVGRGVAPGEPSSRPWPPAGAWAPSTAASSSAARCTTIMRQWWHGRPVPMAGVAGVQVAPEYRGQGVGRAVMTALAELMTERGYPLSVLYPATMTIYRSLGWEIAGHLHEAVLPARALFGDGQAGHEDCRDQAPRPGRRGRGARGHRPRPRRGPRLRPDHLGRGHCAPLADPPRPVRRLRSLCLPGPGRLPRLPLAARQRRNLRRSGGGGLGRDHPALWAVAASNSSVAETCARRSARPTPSGGCCASRTRTSPSGRAGCSACSTRPPPSPPAASPRRTSPYRCRSPMTCWRPTRAAGS